jgi:O-antigen ligase
MARTRGSGYAIVLAAAFVLWVPVGLFGAQGYSGLIGLTAIAAAFFAPLLRTNLVFLTVLALAVWSALSSLWSPESGVIVAGALDEGNFHVDAAGIRILLTVLAGTLTLAAALRIPAGAGRRSLYVVTAMLVVHGLLTLTMGLLPDVALDAYAPFSDRTGEAPQNILRNANAFLLAIPILLGVVCAYAGRATVAACLAILAASFTAFLHVGSDVALLGIVAIAISIGLVMIFLHTGFRILLVGISAVIIISPLLLGVGGAVLAKTDLPLPCSVQSRVWAWQLTADNILDRPLTGHGIEASKEWRETFGDRPDLLREVDQNCRTDDAAWEVYRILPGHPHNMGLQMWAEIGFIGVVLGVLSLLTLGWRLPKPGDLPLQTRIATASLIGASFALFSLSYSVWNEAFWATIAVAAAGVILVHRASFTEEETDGPIIEELDE